jgi:hypothetical protein
MWDHRDSEVGHVETITNIDTRGFTVTSGNAASDYFVHWLAISGVDASPPPRPLPAGEQQAAFRHGVPTPIYGDETWVFEFGRALKREAQRVVYFKTAFAASPTVVISPQWSAGVGHNETINEVATDHFVLHSGNADRAYFVNWLALGRTSRDATGEWVRFEPDFMLRPGSAQKSTRSASIGYANPGPRFATTPTVVLSPYWSARASTVGHAETIDHVDREDVRVVSDNAGRNYQVNALVFGRFESNRP